MLSLEQKQLQEAQLKILKEIDKVCNEHNLTYWLAFGTAIGAVRHKGFIPWDDDIDLFMMAEDLEKLEKLQKFFPNNIFVQSRRTDPEYGLMITRVRDSNTTLIENTESDRNMNHGVFVDIYPLYNSPKEGKEHDKFYRNSLLARLLLYGKTPETHGTVMKLGSKVILSLTSKKFRKNQVERIYQKMLEQPESGYLTYAYGHTGRMIFPKEFFYPVVRVDFEDMKAPIPENNDKLLTQIYGDYMKLPPEDKQVVHHDYRKVDCEHSYLMYKGKDYCLKG